MIYTLDGSDGSVLWSYDNGVGLLTAFSVGLDGSLYGGDSAGKLFAVDKDGDLYGGRHVKSSGVGTNEVVISNIPHDDHFVGRVFEVYTRNVDGTKKTQSVAGDLVVVDVGDV